MRTLFNTQSVQYTECLIRSVFKKRLFLADRVPPFPVVYVGPRKHFEGVDRIWEWYHEGKDAEGTFTQSHVSPSIPAALEASQGQRDGLFSQRPYKCHLKEVASVKD